MSTITKLDPTHRARRAARRRVCQMAHNASRTFARLGNLQKSVEALAIATRLDAVRRAPNWHGGAKEAEFRRLAETLVRAAA